MAHHLDTNVVPAVNKVSGVVIIRERLVVRRLQRTVRTDARGGLNVSWRECRAPFAAQHALGDAGHKGANQWERNNNNRRVLTFGAGVEARLDDQPPPARTPARSMARCLLYGVCHRDCQAVGKAARLQDRLKLC